MTYRAELMSYHSDASYSDPSKGGFETETDAYNYIKEMCPPHPRGGNFPPSSEEEFEAGYCSYCEAEWMTFEEDK